MDDNELFNNSWYHGRLPRNLSEILLKLNRYPNGTFLIRKRRFDEHAINQDSPYSISVLVDAKRGLVNHYKIESNGSQFWMRTQPQHSFCNLVELVNFYKSNIRWFTPGLMKSCKKEFELHQLNDQFVELSHEELIEENLISDRGNFADVYKARWKGIDVVLKKAKQDQQITIKEAEMAERCKHHKNLLKFLAIAYDPGHKLMIVTEYLPSADLLHYFRNEDLTKLKVGHLVNIALQVADGMRHLEKNHICHRDLGARNILINNKTGLVRIGDYGLATECRIEPGELIPWEGQRIPVRWSAPEILFQESYSHKSDVWAFGIVMYEIFSLGEMPFNGQSDEQIKTLIGNGGRLEKPPNCPDDVYEVMCDCWKKEHEGRPTFVILFYQISKLSEKFNQKACCLL